MHTLLYRSTQADLIKFGTTTCRYQVFNIASVTDSTRVFLQATSYCTRPVILSLYTSSIKTPDYRTLARLSLTYPTPITLEYEKTVSLAAIWKDLAHYLIFEVSGPIDNEVMVSLALSQVSHRSPAMSLKYTDTADGAVVDEAVLSE